MSWSATCVPDAVKILRPFQVVSTSGRPRMDKVPTSPPARLVTWIPVTRCSASTTLLSGSLPMSSATTDSTTWSLVRLIARLLISEALTPVTTTVSTGAVLSAVAWAHAEPLPSRPAPASARTPSFSWGRGVFRRPWGVRFCMLSPVKVIVMPGIDFILLMRGQNNPMTFSRSLISFLVCKAQTFCAQQANMRCLRIEMA